MERLHAILRLAWALFRSVFAPLLGARRGLSAFRLSYAKDRLPAVTPPERRQLAKLGGCIACGLCDVGEGARIVASKGRYAGVMDLMLAPRGRPPGARRTAARSDRSGCGSARSVCPARVPCALKAFILARPKTSTKRNNLRQRCANHLYSMLGAHAL
jgi:succinate dehydrogenase/fumarate reductase-like Fe-S protein